MLIRDAVCHKLGNIYKTVAYILDCFRRILFQNPLKGEQPTLLASPHSRLLLLHAVHALRLTGLLHYLGEHVVYLRIIS